MTDLSLRLGVVTLKLAGNTVALAGGASTAHNNGDMLVRASDILYARAVDHHWTEYVRDEQWEREQQTQQALLPEQVFGYANAGNAMRGALLGGEYARYGEHQRMQMELQRALIAQQARGRPVQRTNVLMYVKLKGSEVEYQVNNPRDELEGWLRDS